MKKVLAGFIVCAALAGCASKADTAYENPPETTTSETTVLTTAETTASETAITTTTEPTVPETSEIATSETTVATTATTTATITETTTNITPTAYEVIENMSNEQLIDAARGVKKFDVPDFCEPNDFGVTLGDEERWHVTMLNSVSSVEEARNEVINHALMQNPSEYKADYIGENDYYYEFGLTYKRGDGSAFANRVIVFKTSAMFCSFNSRDGYYSELRALDEKSVSDLLDLKTFFSLNGIGSSRVIYRDFAETDREYEYTYYTAYIIYGDWGINDAATLTKTRIAVDKKTGEFLGTASENIKQTVIEGTARVGGLW